MPWTEACCALSLDTGVRFGLGVLSPLDSGERLMGVVAFEVTLSFARGLWLFVVDGGPRCLVGVARCCIALWSMVFTGLTPLAGDLAEALSLFKDCFFFLPSVSSDDDASTPAKSSEESSRAFC